MVMIVTDSGGGCCNVNYVSDDDNVAHLMQNNPSIIYVLFHDHLNQRS